MQNALCLPNQSEAHKRGERGGLAEWSNAPVLKTGGRESVPRVRIPEPPANIEMLFAHLKRILGLGRLRLRGPCGANDEFLLAATARTFANWAKIFPAPNAQSLIRKAFARCLSCYFLRQQHVVFPQNGRRPVARCVMHQGSLATDSCHSAFDSNGDLQAPSCYEMSAEF